MQQEIRFNIHSKSNSWEQIQKEKPPRLLGLYYQKPEVSGPEKYTLHLLWQEQEFLRYEIKLLSGKQLLIIFGNYCPAFSPSKGIFFLTCIYGICLTTRKQSNYFVYNLKPQNLFRTEIWTRKELHGKSNPHFGAGTLCKVVYNLFFAV